MSHKTFLILRGELSKEFTESVPVEIYPYVPLGSIKTHNAVIGIFNALENAKWKEYMMVGKPFLSA